MAITIDWATKVINIPKAYTLLITSSPQEIRELDTDQFRLDLKALEAEVIDAGAGGMPFEDTHSHNKPITVGGVTLARVIEIINGYTITFEDGQYAVNLVGSNNNIADVTNVNQVSVRSANSAGLVHIGQLLDQSFNSRVWIDTTLGSSGTQYPRGTPTDPVDNLTDALSIASVRKLRTINIEGPISVGGSTDISNFSIIGRSPISSTLTLNGGPTVDTSFEGLLLTGTLNGIADFEKCRFQSVVDFLGTARNSILETSGTVTPKSDVSVTSHMLNCFSGCGATAPILDMTNFVTNDDLAVRAYTGVIEIKNLTGGTVSLDMLSGNVIIDSSCTGGTIIVGGVTDLTDNSAGTTVTLDGHIYAKDLNDKVGAIRSTSAALLGLV